jgi:hypothetical protein
LRMVGYIYRLDIRKHRNNAVYIKRKGIYSLSSTRP